MNSNRQSPDVDQMPSLNQTMAAAISVGIDPMVVSAWARAQDPGQLKNDLRNVLLHDVTRIIGKEIVELVRHRNWGEPDPEFSRLPITATRQVMEFVGADHDMVIAAARHGIEAREDRIASGHPNDVMHLMQGEKDRRLSEQEARDLTARLLKHHFGLTVSPSDLHSGILEDMLSARRARYTVETP